MKVQELYRLSPSFSYNIPHFIVGLEYEFSLAKYGRGNMNRKDGLYSDTQNVNNHRIVATDSYIF